MHLREDRRIQSLLLAILILTAASLLCASRAATARIGVETSIVSKLAGTEIWVVARGRIASEIQASSGVYRFNLRATEFLYGTHRWRGVDRLAVSLPSEVVDRHRKLGQKIDAGVEVEVGGKIEMPPEERRESSLRARSLGTLRVKEFRVTGEAPRWIGVTTAIRQFMRSGAEPFLEEEQSGLLLGLMYGDTEGVTYPTRARFRQAGLSHLTAVSGQNFVLVLGVVGAATQLIPALWDRRRTRTALLVAVSFCFIVLTRWEASVLRAGAMAIVLLVAHMVGIKPSFGEVVGLAVFLALVGDPMLAFSVAFQLSLAATVAIVLWSKRLATVLQKVLKLPRLIAMPVGVALGAELGVGPVIATHFGTVQLLSVPANLLAVPAASIASVWGYFACTLSALFPELGDLLHAGTALPITWVRQVATIASQSGVAELHVGRISWLMVVLIYLVELTLIRILTRYA